MTNRQQRNITPELRDIPLTFMDCPMQMEEYCRTYGSQLAAIVVEQHRMTSSCWFNCENGRCCRGYAR